MAQEQTSDEIEGTAEQLTLPLQWAIHQNASLREELDLIPPHELASALGLAEQTLAAWRSDKAGPDYVKLGKTVFYRREDLKKWIESNTLAAA